MKQDLFIYENEISGAIICILFSLFFLNLLSRYWIKEKEKFRLFKYGFYLRIIGLICYDYFNLIIVKADSLKFYSSAVSVSRLISELRFGEYIKIFYTDFENLSFKIKCYFSNYENYNLVYDSNKTLVHLAGIISYFTFDSYLAISFFFSLCGYLGLWLIYSTFINKGYKKNKLFYCFIILYPTLCFWTTGLMKEPICIGAIGFIFYILFNKIENNFKRVAFFLLAIISAFFLYKIKSYLLNGLILAFVLSLSIYSISKLRAVPKLILSVSLITMVLIALFYSKHFIQNKIIEILSEEITDKVSGITTAQLNHGGSSYDLGQFELSGWSFFKYLIASINVALFRPYLWEYLKPQVFLSSLDGLLMNIMFLYILFKKKFSGILKMFKRSVILLFSFFYTIILAIMIGGIAFNFGTLSRYKVPLTPFFFAVFIILYSDSVSNRKSLKNE